MHKRGKFKSLITSTNLQILLAENTNDFKWLSFFYLTMMVANGNLYRMESEELIAWRKKQGINQVELAKLLGVTKACISRWEAGKRQIPPFLHIALKCLKVKKGGKIRSKQT